MRAATTRFRPRCACGRLSSTRITPRSVQEYRFSRIGCGVCRLEPNMPFTEQPRHPLVADGPEFAGIHEDIRELCRDAEIAARQAIVDCLAVLPEEMRRDLE